MTAPEPPGPPPPGPSAAPVDPSVIPARVSFFAALGAGFLPILALPIPWLLYALNRARVSKDAPGQRPWMRALLLLALFDLVVAAAAVTLTRRSSELLSLRAQEPRSAVGVVLDPEAADGGVRVQELSRGSPAADAGLRSGDVIAGCDGAEVRSAAELRRCIGARAPGAEVRLRVLRPDGADQELTVATRPAASFAPPLPVELAPGQNRCDATLEPPGRGPLAAWALFVLLGLYVLFRKGGGATLALAGSIGVIALGGSYVGAGLCALGLPETVRELLQLPLSPLSLLLAAVLVNRFMLRGESPGLLSGERGWWKVALLAVWTHLTVMVRLAVVLGAVLIVTRAGPISATPVEELVAQGARQGWLKLLFFLSAAVLAPLGEEYFFRGVALTSLARVLSPLFAIAGTALVFGLLHGGYGIRAPIVVALGAILGWARWESRGLKAPIVLHALQNAVVAAMFLFRE